MAVDDDIADLRVQIAARNVTLVVGAGVSILATGGAPTASWTGLLRSGVEAVKESTNVDDLWTEKISKSIDEAPIEDVFPIADEIVAKLGGDGTRPNIYRRWLKRSLGTLKASRPDALYHLAALNVPIVTTNYDSLIEENTDLKAISWTDFAKAQRLLRGDDPGVLHLHGHWNDPASVILNMASYWNKEESTGIKQLQRAATLTSSLLFVGVGAGSRDPDVGSLIRWSTLINKDSDYVHYRLCRRSDLMQLRREHHYDNIQPVVYGENFEDLEDFLALLIPASSISLGTGFVAPRATPEDLDPELVKDYARSQGQKIDDKFNIAETARRLRLVSDDGLVYEWAILCLAADPSVFFPGSTTKVVMQRTLKTTAISGGLSRQVASTTHLLRELLPMPHLSGPERQAFLLAVREAVSNAISHRDYRDPQSTTIYVYKDGIVVENPGALSSTIGNASSLTVRSQPPHPNRSRILHYLGAAEGAGLGFESYRRAKVALKSQFPWASVVVQELDGAVRTILRAPLEPQLEVSLDESGSQNEVPTVQPEPRPQLKTSPTAAHSPPTTPDAPSRTEADPRSNVVTDKEEGKSGQANARSGPGNQPTGEQSRSLLGDSSTPPPSRPLADPEPAPAANGVSSPKVEVQRPRAAAPDLGSKDASITPPDDSSQHKREAVPDRAVVQEPTKRSPKVFTTPFRNAATHPSRFDWKNWVSSVQKRSRLLNAQEILVQPTNPDVADAPADWVRTTRDLSQRGLNNVLESGALANIIWSGRFDPDVLLAVIVLGLARQGRDVVLVGDDEIDNNELPGIVEAIKSPNKLVMVIWTSEPVRAYYPVSEAADDFVVVSSVHVGVAPFGMNAEFWQTDRLREDAATRLMTPLARGELRASPSSAGLFRKLILAPSDVDSVGKAAHRMGKGSSIVDMLRALEGNLSWYRVDASEVRRVLRSRPHGVVPIDLTGPLVDSAIDARMRSHWIRIVLLMVVLLATWYGVAHYILGFDWTQELATVLVGGCLMVAGSAVRTRISGVDSGAVWLLVPPAVVALSLATASFIFFGLGVGMSVAVAVGSYCLYLLGLGLGVGCRRGLQQMVKSEAFYARARTTVSAMKRFAKFGLLKSEPASDDFSTPAGRSVGAQLKDKDVFWLENEIVEQWLGDQEK